MKGSRQEKRRGGTTESKWEINYLVLRGGRASWGVVSKAGSDIWWKRGPRMVQWSGLLSVSLPHPQPSLFLPPTLPGLHGNSV